MRFFSEQKIQSFVQTLAIILSSILPVLLIVIFYVVRSEKTRLGLIVIFCLLCSAALATLTNAKNVEIITATAAYVLHILFKLPLI
jgi:branched-subunit amino acid transport protein AzlD